MTVSPSTTAPSADAHAGVPEAPGCPACPHPLSAHDRIGVRFCLATAAGSTGRGCVCSTT